MLSTASILTFIVSAVSAYLLGSISFSIIITQKVANTDVRSHGSGNAGTTNVLRTAGKLPALLTFAGDFLKCVAAILLSVVFLRLFGADVITAQIVKYTAGIFCLLGHIFPVFFGFRGGKGVAVTGGLILMLDWRCFLIGFGIFLILTVLTRYVSLGSVIGTMSFPIATFAFQFAVHEKYVVLNTVIAALIACIVVIKHRTNIIRLFNGEEKKLSFKKAV